MAQLKIELDTEQLPVLVQKGGQIELSEEAIEAFFQLKAIEERAKEGIEIIKRAIMKQGARLTPEFGGTVGDDLRGYVKEGDKYEAIDKSVIPSWALKEIKYTKLDQKEVEMYEKEKGELPSGVKKKEEVISFVLLYDKERVKNTQIQLFAKPGVAKKPRLGSGNVSTQRNTKNRSTK